jgi:hypothetical protein
MKIKTIGDLKSLIKNLDDFFEIEMRVRKAISEERLNTMSYPYPWDSENGNLEFDDIGYSDKVVCFSVDISDLFDLQ